MTRPPCLGHGSVPKPPSIPQRPLFVDPNPVAPPASALTALGRPVTPRHFSHFLKQEGPGATAAVLSRELILEYIHYLNESGVTAVTRHQRLILLRTFLETANINDWLSTSPFIIRAEDLPRMEKRAPRFIPETVLEQLNRHLDQLPPQLMRMILVLEETGLRIGELLLLALDCIEQDIKGDWFLRFTSWKMRKEQVIPISRELAGVIQEQREYIQTVFGDNFSYLFCANRRGPRRRDDDRPIPFSPAPKVMSPKTFIRHLQRFAELYEIRDASGAIWKFQTHQFRHTVGARMINSGVPPHIIQRYLGHESPEMTMRYAHIHDETLKKELADYLDGTVVNVSGEVVDSVASELDHDTDLQWVKRKVLAQALPNGSCARPVAKGPCPHANACLTCGDFRTTAEFLPQHREQLEQTDTIIAKAEENGWTRQAEMNQQVRRNLLNIITTLEEPND